MVNGQEVTKAEARNAARRPVETRCYRIYYWMNWIKESWKRQATLLRPADDCNIYAKQPKCKTVGAEVSQSLP